MATRLQTAAHREAATQFLTDDFQRGLARWNHERLSPRFPDANWQVELERDMRMLRLEGGFIEELRAEIADAAAEAPEDPDQFIAWFEALEAKGPGQHDPLFPWLAEEATAEEMRWFLEQEAAGEAGFEDLTAMTQVKLPKQAKLELARNYWDEMGRGNPKGMHGPMLDALVEAMELAPEIDRTCWESLALANAMTAMATSRRYAWHAVGALGAIELTAPARAACVANGLRRLGYSGKVRRYFELHAVLDVKHSAAWNEEALRPLVEEDPRRARAMAEGALIRLKCGERCFERYRAHLWG
ncbi:MAG TPA: iron-containing redox enzyme family protein [Allosphingosinicella sp.]|uniref:iron-containing redox enzyme family protein n=1 Tax=Allosphingosinicella sp. TaxID=2823234 RepID=UPI002ED8F95E